MRNETLPVSAAQAKANLIMRDTLRAATVVTLDYRKPDGSTSVRTGTVVSVGGDMATTKAHVVLDTDKGPRTLSFHGISNVR